MRRFCLLIIVLMLVLSACARATSSPAPTTTATATPTRTISPEEITAAASLIRTLPASFTPTFTPSVTPTRNTETPTPRPTATIIPEDILCDAFIVSPAPLGSVPIDDIEDYIQVFIEFESITVEGEITNMTTGELVESGTVSGGTVWDFNFTSFFYPEIGDYEYVFTLTDGTREGMCERRGRFDTRPDEVLTPSPEVTAEVTAEVTEIAESTAEVTQEVASAEQTEAVERTQAVTQATQATPIRVPFPPR